MRFLKITDIFLGKDVLHIWIEDDCAPDIVEKAVRIHEFDNARFKVTDRKYEKVA